jgi:hypothetical protein
MSARILDNRRFITTADASIISNENFLAPAGYVCLGIDSRGGNTRAGETGCGQTKTDSVEA